MKEYKAQAKSKKVLRSWTLFKVKSRISANRCKGYFRRLRAAARLMGEIK